MSRREEHVEQDLESRKSGRATLADWRRHAGWLFVVATIVWTAIRIHANRV